MTQLTFADVPDITRNRHRGNSESRAAARKVHPHKSESYRSILFYLNRLPASAKEYAVTFNLQLNKVSGRFSELKAGGLIEKAGWRRAGAAVLKITSDGYKALRAVQCGLATIEHIDNAVIVKPKRYAILD